MVFADVIQKFNPKAFGIVAKTKIETSTAPKAIRRARPASKREAASGSSAGFLARTRLMKAGGSLVVTVPASARNLLHLTEGQEMTVSVEGSKVIMEPVPSTSAHRIRRPKYTLEELIAGSRPEIHMSEEERAWHDAPAVGREVW